MPVSFGIDSKMSELGMWLLPSAMASLAILAVGSAGVLLWRQPARRVRIIEWTLAGCLVAPLVGMIPGYPRLALSWPEAAAPIEQEVRETASPGFEGRAARTKIEATVQATAGANVVVDGEAVRMNQSTPPASIAMPGETTEASRPALGVGSLLAVLYGVGVVIGAGWWLIGIVGLARIIRTSRPAPPHCRELLHRIAGPGEERVRLLVNRRLKQPFAAAWGRPVIVLPESLCGEEQALRWSLAHEWTHVDRHDFRAWLLAGLARVLFFYQPLLWWLRVQLRFCQDLLADGQAARQSPEPEDYAEFLTIRAAAGSLHPAMAGLGIGFHKSELYRRIIMLVRNQPLESRVPRLWTVSISLAALLAIAATATLSSARTEAEEVKPDAPKPTSVAPKQEKSGPESSRGSSESSKSPAAAKPKKLDQEQLVMMGRVEDFFMHNFRDITSRKSLEWGDVEKHPDGSRSIRYMFEARIWDKESMIGNQVFTFDKQGEFRRAKTVEGYPKKKVVKPADTSTKEGMIELVEDFFKKNFVDITSRKTLEWGEPTKDAKGNTSIRYKYAAQIWDKELKVMNQVFTFDSKGEFVSVKDVEGFPKND